MNIVQRVDVDGKTVCVLTSDVERAEERIAYTESVLQRFLTRGERHDLIMDNFTTWSSSYCRAIVAAVYERGTI